MCNEGNGHRMIIGYACLTVGVLGTKQKNCMMKNASDDVLMNLIQHNLESLDRILDYNIQNDIKLFRISSDIIPFGSHHVNTLRWWEMFSDELKKIGYKALSNGMRLSMHPGQYTVLNSPDESVATHAVEDLEYHCRFLDSLGLGSEHKIVLHIGGVYGDKAFAMRRFIQRYRCLNENIRRRLVIENDDRQYTVSDVLTISKSEGIPVVFDNLHHEVNPDNTKSDIEWIACCRDTWKVQDGPQKLHYSQQDKGKRLGSHSATLYVDDFLHFYKRISNKDTDIMVEVKDKNLSAIKCINAIASPHIKRLEKEWGRYKYLILEHSPNIYNEIRQLLKDKKTYPVSQFYKLIDEALKSPVSAGNAVNAALHVWGYVNNLADDKTKLIFEKNLKKVSQGGSTTSIKRHLLGLAEIQKQEYLLNSLYLTNMIT